MKLKPTLLLLAALTGAALALAVQAAERAEPAPKTWRVSAQGIASPQSAEGSVEAERQALLSLPVQGAVVALPVRAGDALRAGQLLMRIDARAAQQGAAAAAAQQEAIGAQLRLAEQDLARQRQLKGQGFISQAALEQAETQFRATEAQLRAQRSQASAAATQAGLHELRAPFDGLLAELPVSLGDLALPGRPLATVYDPRALRVTVNLPVAQLPPAHTAFSIEIGALRLQPTRVERLPMVDAQSHTAQLRLQLPAGTPVAPGQFARVHWTAAAAEGGNAPALMVPRSSLMQRGELDLLVVLTPEGRSVLRQVRLGRTVGDRVEVLAGLKAGEQLVLEPLKGATR